MHFQSLVSLWFGLTLPAIVLMYLLKRKYIDTEVPSTLLWNRVLRNLEANRPWQKLRSNLLLILQLLVASLLVLTLMQPFIWSDRGVKGHVVLVLDRSASMDALLPASSFTADDTGAKGEHPMTRLELAKRRAAELASKEASGRAVTVIAMGAQPEVLATRERKTDAVLAALRGIEPFYGKTAYKETMSLAASLIQEDADAEIRVYTDSQWTESTSGIVFRTPVKVERIGEEPADNVSIVQFGVKASSGTEAAIQNSGDNAGNVSGVAILKNNGAAKRQVEVTLYTGGTVGEVRRVAFEPGEQKRLGFGGLRTADFYKLELETKDAYTADNRAFAFLSGDRMRKVLLVTEGNLFLEKALQLARTEVVKVQMKVSELQVPPKGEFDLVILDGVSSRAIASEPWQKLLQQKPVWYIGGSSDGKQTNPPQADFRITEHLVTRYIQFQDTHFAKLREVGPVAWGQPIVTIGTHPLIYAGTEKGYPRLLFAFDLQQSDLPLRTEFPILVQNAIDWLGNVQVISLGREIAGEKKEIPVSAKTVSAEWMPLDTLGTGSAAVPAEQSKGAVLSAQTVPGRPGLYQFIEKEEGGSERKTYLEVTSDPKESNINVRKELVFAKPAMPESEAGSGSGSEAQQLSGKSDQTPYLLLPWIVALITIIVLVEWGVYRRGNSVS